MSSRVVCMIPFSGIPPEKCVRIYLMFLESLTDTVTQKPKHLSLSSNPWLHRGQAESPEANELRLTFVPAILLHDVYVIKYNNNETDEKGLFWLHIMQKKKLKKRKITNLLTM